MDNLKSQIAVTKKSLFDEELLDLNFTNLEDIQDSASPNFVEDVFNVFFEDSERRILKMETALKEISVDYSALYVDMYGLRGSACSVGACRLENECKQLRNYLDACNGEGCLRTLAMLRSEHSTLKSKMQAYFELVKQARSMESSVEPKP